MPRYIIKEGILNKFLDKLFGSIARGKGEKAASLLSKDPILQGHIRQATKAADDVKRHLIKKRKSDPELDILLKRFNL